MGVNISKIIPKKEIEFSFLKGKTVAIDAYVTLYQFLTTIRQPDGTPLKDSSGNVTSHLSGLFYRNINLLQEGIKPVYVFDGKPPNLKAEEIEKRQTAKKEAESKYQEAKIKDDIRGMKKYSSRTVKITKDILTQSKELLSALGIPIILANSEGEAEAATLAKNKKVYAAASQDYDAILYATPFLIRNLTSPRRKKLSNGLYVNIKPELVDFKNVLEELKINHDQLICLAILVGTDYNPGGIKGLGQQRALQLVQSYKTPKEIFNSIPDKYEIAFEWEKIFNQFKNYETSQVKEITFKEIDEDKVKKILTKYEFSEARISSGLQKLKDVEESKKQKGLNDFF